MSLIQAATEAELPALAELYAQALGHDGPDPLEELRRMRERGVVLCAQADGQTIGLGVAGIAADEMEIHSVAVAPHARRCGLGHRLVQALEAAGRALGATRAFLEVRAANTPARTLYTRAGYTPCGTRPGYYRDGEDAVMMQRDLGATCGG